LFPEQIQENNMRWTPGGESQDIEDRRDETGGGGGGFQFGGMHLGIGGALVLLVLSLIFKQNFFALLGGGGASAPATVSQPDTARDASEKPLVQFISFVLDDTQNNWAQILPQQTGRQYHHAKLVLYRDATQSACGGAQSATGPFYCPGDEKVYIDLGFYDELNRRFGAPGQFAQAYVLAHEIGHHVQNILGIEQKAQQGAMRGANSSSVKLELQADCFAGIWAHSTQQRGLLEQGDVQSALGAAAAVGDDRLQKMQTGRVSPDSFTHGTSQERMAWFNKGFSTGSIAACNTFDAQSLGN
jgi:predicted metalloprotease